MGKDISPFEGRAVPAGRFEPGSDAAGQQLEDFCDRMNTMRFFGRWYFVTGDAPKRRVDSMTVNRDVWQQNGYRRGLIQPSGDR